MTYYNIFSCLLRVCVHCAVLGKQLLRPSTFGLVGCVGWLLSHSVTAVIASRKRPVPFRTRKLSSIAPMVLHSEGCGRVGRRRTSSLGVEECLNPLLLGCSPPPLPFFAPENSCDGCGLRRRSEECSCRRSARAAASAAQDGLARPLSRMMP